MWFSAQDSALLHLLLNIVSFFISFRQKCVPFWYVLYHTGLYRLCTSFEGASWRGQPLNILSWFTGAGGVPFFASIHTSWGRGWGRTNFVELCSVSRPRLAEMAIGIWVMCQLTEKLFETSLVWWNLQVRIFVQVLRDTSIISEHSWEWKRKETCIESKEGWHFWIFCSIPRI